MLAVTIRLFEDGCLSGFTAVGHVNGASAGENIPCAAASVLLRTAARVLLSTEGLTVEGSRDAPGGIFLRIVSRGRTDARRLSGITDFLLRGLRDLEAEFPSEVAIVIEQ